MSQSVHKMSKGNVVFQYADCDIQWDAATGRWAIYDRAGRGHHHAPTLGLAYSRADDLRDKVPTIGLVACCKTKLDRRTTAENLYASDLFQKAAAYCRLKYDRWFILSAKYGLVVPCQLIDPYEETLVGKSADEQRKWAGRVVGQLKSRDLLNRQQVFMVHAGADYARFLVEHLPRHELPLKGLGIGQQLGWYKKALTNSVPTALAEA